MGQQQQSYQVSSPIAVHTPETYEKSHKLERKKKKRKSVNAERSAGRVESRLGQVG